MKIVLLAAPTRFIEECDAAIPAWYDYKLISKGVEQANETHLGMTGKRVMKEVAKYAKELGDDYTKIILGGFSQGCVVSLYTALAFGKEIGGICGLSGYLVPFITLPTDCKKTKILLYHGKADDKLNYVMAMKSYERLKAAGIEAKIISEAKMQHEISPNELKEIETFFSTFK